MTSLDRQRVKGRREGGTFVPLPHAILEHDNFKALSAWAIRLLIDLAFQLRFQKGRGPRNNGDLTAAWSIMKQRGWKSKGTLNAAIKELKEYGWIIVTRQGGRHKASLYAVTWLAINECGGKLDIAETPTPLGYWKEKK